MRPTRVYGFTGDYGSYAQVTRGFLSALTHHGHTPDTLEAVSLEDQHQGFGDDEPRGLPLADIGILTGPPIAASVLTEGVKHARRLVMIHPNSSKLPERTMHTVNTAATEILASSAWGATVISRYTALPVIVAPCGVDQGFAPRAPKADLEAQYEAGEFRILHLSSTTGQRKGTLELVRAFLEAMDRGRLPPNSELSLVLAPGGKGQLVDFIMDYGSKSKHTGRIVLLDRLAQYGLSPGPMAEIYSSVHVICQPSRGEGFGMVPLEALASGCPIVATACTGHSEWFTKGLPGAVRVATGAPQPVDDMVGAEAPGLLMSDLQEGLVTAHQDWTKLKAAALGNATSIGAKWSWPAQLASLIGMLEGAS